MNNNQFCLKIKKNSSFFYENEDMSKHCSMRAGEVARFYCEPKNRSSLAEIIKLCNEFGVKYYLLGNGTNTIFYNYDGMIICTKQIRGIDIVDDIFVCDAGVSLMRLNIFASGCLFSGLEWSYGIPGTVGGAVIMNAGSYGHEISEVVEKVQIFDGNRFKTLRKKQFWFKYRDSYFAENKCIVSKVYIKLKKEDEGEKIKQRMMECFEKRKENQPLEYPSSGSVFKRNENVIPSQIIDKLGLKGTNINGAEISTKHAGFIVNKGGAKVGDIEKLINFARQKVFEKTNINLDCEIIVVKE